MKSYKDLQVGDVITIHKEPRSWSSGHGGKRPIAHYRYYAGSRKLIAPCPLNYPVVGIVEVFTGYSNGHYPASIKIDGVSYGYSMEDMEFSFGGYYMHDYDYLIKSIKTSIYERREKTV